MWGPVACPGPCVTLCVQKSANHDQIAGMACLHGIQAQQDAHCLLGKLGLGVVLSKADAQFVLHARGGHFQHPCGRVQALLYIGHPIHTLQAIPRFY